MVKIKEVDLFSWFKNKFFTKDEVTNKLAEKSDVGHEHGDLYYTETEIDTFLNSKADLDTATQSKDGLMSSSDKTKLDGVETGANKTIVDTTLSDSSENPVQNKIIKEALDSKVDKVNGKGLSTEDFTTAEKTKLAGLDNVTVDASLSDNSENPVQNKIIKGALDGKASLSHSHSSVDVTDENAYTNLGTSAGASQSVINSAVDTKIGALLNVDIITVVATRPTASAETMNKLYFVPETDAETEDAYEVFVTIEENGNYSWEKIDTARLDLSDYVRKEDVGLSLSSEGVLSITVE